MTATCNRKSQRAAVTNWLRLSWRVYTTEKFGFGPAKKVGWTQNFCTEILEFPQGHRLQNFLTKAMGQRAFSSVQKIAGGIISGFDRKSFTGQNSPNSKVLGFKVPTSNSGFKISANVTKPGSFYIGFVHLCVNGKTKPVLKRSGFVTNPEQFSLV